MLIPMDPSCDLVHFRRKLFLIRGLHAVVNDRSRPSMIRVCYLLRDREEDGAPIFTDEESETVVAYWVRDNVAENDRAWFQVMVVRRDLGEDFP